MGLQTFTFLTASPEAATYTSYDKMDIGNGTRIARVTATVDETSIATGATVRFVLTDGTLVYCVKNCTVTTGSLRAGMDGASGAYVATCLFASDSENDKLDLLGNIDSAASGKLHWRVGLADIGGFASGKTMTVRLAYDSEV